MLEDEIEIKRIKCRWHVCEHQYTRERKRLILINFVKFSISWRLLFTGNSIFFYSKSRQPKPKRNEKEEIIKSWKIHHSFIPLDFHCAMRCVPTLFTLHCSTQLPRCCRCLCRRVLKFQSRAFSFCCPWNSNGYSIWVEFPNIFNCCGRARVCRQEYLVRDRMSNTI